MSNTMKTFVMKRIGELGFFDKPIPRPGPNDAVVKTTRALVCNLRYAHDRRCHRRAKQLDFGP